MDIPMESPEPVETEKKKVVKEQYIKHKYCQMSKVKAELWIFMICGEN
jgi:hypothetical protein